LDQSLADIRSLTFEISPPVLYDYGLGEALEWLAEHMKQRHGLAVELHREGEARGLDLDRQVSLYRACQELLVNVVKHARAQRAWVALSSQPGQTVLEVRDDGRGFDAAVLEGRSGGFGLFSIRERLEPLGGGMRVDSAPGRGARITLRLPPGRETNAE
jgi:signal transduction histidine kinase